MATDSDNTILIIGGGGLRVIFRRVASMKLTGYSMHRPEHCARAEEGWYSHSGIAALLYSEQLIPTQAGIRALVYESEPAGLQRARDWNIGLHWSAPILETLIPPESFAKIDSVQVDPSKPCPPSSRVDILNGQTGEKIGGTTLPHFYRIIRSKLRALIAEGLDIQYGKTLTSVQYSDDGKTVTASFADGTSATGALLIGADGARSRIRQLLLGEKRAALTILPFAATIVQAKYTSAQAKFLRSWHPLYIMAVHPAGMISWVGLHSAQDPEDPENWILNHYISWPSSLADQEETKDWTNKMRLEQLKEKSKLFTDPFRSAFEWLSEDQPVWYAPLSQWDPSLEEHQWGNMGGRVTLAGDAAHPMTFQRGQGLNSGIKDASELVNQIRSFMGTTDKTRKEAIDAYESEMKTRAGLEVRLSSQNTSMVHHWEQVMQSPLITKGFTKQ
ncbi:MAG: hypothetical protein M1818_000523 [Claussenomyces sp. TS43310]|nr:MAG: hypothetical protein M1818_000523 [Claussenomyces sp. TS43310]